MQPSPSLAPELLEGADPVSAATWSALFEAHYRGRELLRSLYRAQGGDQRPDLTGFAENLGVDVMHASRRTPAHISRDARSQREDGRPVPHRTSRRDFQDVGALFKALTRLLHETSPEGMAEWVNPALPPLNFEPHRSELATALAACEEPMRKYVRKLRQLKAMERLGHRSETW